MKGFVIVADRQDFASAAAIDKILLDAAVQVKMAVANSADDLVVVWAAGGVQYTGGEQFRLIGQPGPGIQLYAGTLGRATETRLMNVIIANVARSPRAHS